MLDFFRSRWTEDRDPGDVGQLPRADTQIGMSENALLVRHVTGEEVQEAVWALAGDKAPGPDGFPPFFFKRYWGIIRVAVVEAVRYFFSHAVMPDDWRATYVTLIPKRQDAREPSHFRPIIFATTL